MRSVQFHGHAQVGNSTGNQDMLNEMLVTIQIRWCYGGKQVAVEGSWDEWKSKYKDMSEVFSYEMFLMFYLQR